MEMIETRLPGVVLLQPRVFRDERGSFRETWRRDLYVAAGVPAEFVQDNAALSKFGVIRGLHYQYPQPQGKLISVLYGEVYDVAVDVRVGSPAFGQWTAEKLSASNGHQLWIPEGLAHGYAVLSETAVLSYKCTRAYHPDGERSLRWNDPAIGIRWPLAEPVLSLRDLEAPTLDTLRSDQLPGFSSP